MNILSSRLKWLVVLLILGATLLPTHTVRAAAPCWEASCEGKDAYRIGCAGAGASWRVIDMRYIYHYATGANIGYVQLWWSDTCHANWSRVVSTSGAKYFKGYMYTSGGGEYSVTEGYGTSVITPMQNGYYLWGACGAIGDVYAAHASGACTGLK